MKGIYLWQSFVIHFIFFRMCCILDQIHGCTPTDKIRNKRSQTMLASGQQPHFTAVEGRVGCFFAWHIHERYNSDARNIENTKQNATRPKPLTEFICENFKRDSDEDYPDWGNSRVHSSLRDLHAMPSPYISPYTEATQMATGDVTHQHRPFTPFPPPATPQMKMWLLHHGCLETSSLSLGFLIRREFMTMGSLSLFCLPQHESIHCKDGNHGNCSYIVI